jgi:hypothetical protein
MVCKPPNPFLHRLTDLHGRSIASHSHRAHETGPQCGSGVADHHLAHAHATAEMRECRLRIAEGKVRSMMGRRSWRAIARFICSKWRRLPHTGGPAMNAPPHEHGRDVLGRLAVASRTLLCQPGPKDVTDRKHLLIVWIISYAYGLLIV